MLSAELANTSCKADQAPLFGATCVLHIEHRRVEHKELPTESNMAEKAQDKVQSGSGAAGGGELDATPGGAQQQSSAFKMHAQADK